MTTLAHRAPPSRGGLAARRAVIRWAGRMLRRDWRQQALVTALLIAAVTAAVAGMTVVYNIGPGEDSEFGSATQMLTFDGGRPRALAAGLAAAEQRFGTTDAIGHRSVAVPGSVDTIDFRTQDPNGPYGGELLSLRRGHYPTGAGDVAVTDGVADLLRVGLGATVALDGARRTVVGIVENPRDLGDEFALVSPASAGAPQNVTVLADAGSEAADGFHESLPEGSRSALVQMASREDDRAAAALAMLSVATVFLLLALLIAAAGFAVVAQRRLRHLGMLAAIGATERHVRLVLVANGALVGAIAALVGTIAGLAVWVAVGPTLESAVGHRIDRLSLPAALIATTAVLAVLGAAAAAWWPARAVARIPVMLALSGRPARPRPARHAALAATLLLAVGVVMLALSDRDRAPLIVTGILATILGCLLLGPLAIRVFSGAAARVPIGPRLALRDLVRFQARSGAALAAVTLALGIAATIVVVASAEEAKSASRPINLSDRQLRVYLGPQEVPELTPVDAPAQIDALAARVREIAAQLGNATVVPLHKAYRKDEPGPVVGDTSGFATIELTRREGRQYFQLAGQMYVATPAVLRYLGIDPASVASSTDYLADPGTRTADLVIPNFGGRGVHRVTNVQRVETGRHLVGNPWGELMDGTKPTFITQQGLRRYGWDSVPNGWVLDASEPLTSEQLAEARELAANAGFVLEAQREPTSHAGTIAVAIGVSALLALGILAITVGLIRSESAGDLRTLTAAGATARIRRTLTATTAGALALLGALLGVAGAYVVLLAIYHDDLGYLSDVPVLHLALAVIGVPLAASAAGWLLAGREPPAIARPVID
jgi:putative ABC transport system permease protein